MLQKYSVYWNGKTLLFNNSQDIQLQGTAKFFFDILTEPALEKALNWLEKSAQPGDVAILEYISFDKALPVLKKMLNFVEAAGGLVTNPGKEILFINRLNKWDLPKGKLEPGENPEEGAAREITEETGIEPLELIRPLCHTWHIYDMFERRYIKQTHWYHFTTNTNSVPVAQVEEQISDAIWLPVSDLQKVIVETYPAILDVLKAYMSNT